MHRIYKFIAVARVPATYMMRLMSLLYPTIKKIIQISYI